MCYVMPVCQAEIPNVKGWCLINGGLIHIVVPYTGSQCDDFVK